MIAAPSIRDQPLAREHTAAARDAVCRDIRLDHGASTASRQDDAAASNYLPSVTTPASLRAALAAGDGSSLLAATLAFFLSRPASRPTERRTGRLRL